jgi:hypothetical protein
MRRLLISAVLAIILALVGVRVLYALFISCCAPPVVCCTPQPVDAGKADR